MNRRDMLRLAGAGAIGSGCAETVEAHQVKDPVSAENTPLPDFFQSDLLTYDERLVAHHMQAAHDRWVGTHMLNGLHSERDRYVMAMCLENQRVFNQLEQRPVSDDGYNGSIHIDDKVISHWGTDPTMRLLSIPIVYKAMKRVLENRWIGVEPLMQATGLIYYWRLRNKPDGKSVYVKESESIYASTFHFGLPWQPDGDQQKIVDSYSDALSDMILAYGAVNTFNNAKTRCTTTLAEAKHKVRQIRQTIDDDTYRGNRPGTWWALLPPERPRSAENYAYNAAWIDIEAQLQAQGFEVYRRPDPQCELLYAVNRFDLRPWNDQISSFVWPNSFTIGFTGNRLGEVGYVTCPFVPITVYNHADGVELASRCGHKILPEGSKFFADFQVKDIPA